MTGWTSVEATGGGVPRWRQGEGGLRHRWALHRRSSRRRRGGRRVVSAGGAGGVKQEARLRLREGQFEQSVGGRGVDGERGGRDGECGCRQITLRRLGALVVEEGGGERREGAAVVTNQRPARRKDSTR